LLPPTVPEVRRLLLIALLVDDEAERAFGLGWSRWRRQHQARARRSHYRRRLARQPARAPPHYSTV
jgi:hypothetical protein